LKKYQTVVIPVFQQSGTTRFIGGTNVPEPVQIGSSFHHNKFRAEQVGNLLQHVLCCLAVINLEPIFFAEYTLAYNIP